MAKPGDEYQDIVGAVQRALDPGAEVRVGVWIIGPDGRRDLDVEVRGTLNGIPYSTQVECKDWSDPVGIAVIDALDSKRRDIGADSAVVYSNSGFTEPAIRKASRVGIGLASALRAIDQRIRVGIHKELFAKLLSVETLKAVLFPRPDLAPQFPEGWSLAKLSFQGNPVQNWIADRSLELLREHEPDGWHRFTLCFQPDCDWTYDGYPVTVGAMRIFMQCKRKWTVQTVRADASLGLYDHIRKSVTIPDQQGYWLGWIDQHAWKPIDLEPETEQLAPGTFSIGLTMFNPIRKIDPPGVPDLTTYVLEQEWIKCEPP
jgi:Restriction endonuclease